MVVAVVDSSWSSSSSSGSGGGDGGVGLNPVILILEKRGHKGSLGFLLKEGSCPQCVAVLHESIVIFTKFIPCVENMCDVVGFNCFLTV